MAQRGSRPVRTVRASAPMEPRIPVLRQPPPQKSYTGKALAVMLGALFVAVVLVAATKGFGALGHPLLGLFIGLAVLVLSGLLYWRQVKLGEAGRARRPGDEADPSGAVSGGGRPRRTRR